MKIKGVGGTENFSQIFNSIGRYVFVYGLLLWCFLCAFLAAYFKANKEIRFFNSISQAIKDEYQLIIIPKPLNPKYNYLDFEISGNYENNRIIIDKFQKDVRIILCVLFGNNVNFQKQKLDFDKKYKQSNVRLNCYGFLKNINEKEWKRLSVNGIENIIKELILISEIEKFAIIKIYLYD
jgi:hypothetical protein